MLSSIRTRLERAIGRNIDLLMLWILLIAVQPLIPVDHLLARGDLVPWLMFCLSAAVFLRGKSYGDGPHISLTKQKSRAGELLLRAAMVVTPIVLAFWYDLGKGLDIALTGSADGAMLIALPVVSSVLTGVLVSLSSANDRTAWNPPGIASGLVWFLWSLVIFLLAIAAGQVELLYPSFPSEGLLLGVSFLAVGLIGGRTQHLRQRLSAGLKDGRPYRVSLFPYLFSSVGSALGLIALYTLQGSIGLGEEVSFDQAFVPAAFVVAWAGVLWPKRVPIAVGCLLHEIMPAGGADKTVSTTASPFDQHPKGALRINPLQIKRIRAIHPWLVPVKASRVPELDDPIRPLWPRREPPSPVHVLGQAFFEPCPHTNKEQWTELTLSLKGNEDVASVAGGAAVNRSIVVLKPFLRPGSSRKRRITTYKWEPSVYEGSVQHVDSTTETLSLENGSIIVLATEGVARAFELEIGEPLYRLTDVAGFRPPQIEDYVEL